MLPDWLLEKHWYRRLGSAIGLAGLLWFPYVLFVELGMPHEVAIFMTTAWGLYGLISLLNQPRSN